jgi:hypothetical protein
MSIKKVEDKGWQRTDTQVFWGEIAPADHMMQIYENDDIFLNVLEGFVSSGLKAHECVIIIATDVHVQLLNERLRKHGFNLQALIADNQYIPLDAEETLASFMVNGWPDENLFQLTVSRLIQRADSRKRKVRAFGEMVAALWACGLTGATVQLENLWTRFCKEHSMSLFCAYPKSGFTQHPHDSIHAICEAHSRMISGSHNSQAEIFHKTVHSHSQSGLDVRK